jgi:putative endonuclease
MYTTYVLPSKRDDVYTGCSGDLNERFARAQEGRVRSRAYRVLLEGVDYQACLHREDAFRRERFLKSVQGKPFLR